MTESEAPATRSDLEHDVFDVIRGVFGEMPSGVREVRRGVMTFKFAAEVQERTYMVRFYPESRREVVEYEPDLLRRCLDAGMPVPKVVEDSRSGPPASLPYVAYEMVPGISLAERFGGLNADRLAELGQQVGQALQPLADLPVEGYGQLLTAFHATSPSWEAFVRESFAGGLTHVGGVSPDLVKRLRRIGERFAGSGPGKNAALAWGDVSAENIILDDQDQLSGLVDFEGTLAAEPHLTIGYCYAGSGGAGLAEALAAGWPQPLDADDWERIWFFAALRAVRLLKYSGQPLPTGGYRMPLQDLLPGITDAVRRLVGTL